MTFFDQNFSLPTITNSPFHLSTRFQCVRNLWPFISEIIWDILKESVEPAIQEQLTDVKFDVFDLLEAFHFKTFDLGQQVIISKNIVYVIPRA